jgi:hypothetical protein
LATQNQRRELLEAAQVVDEATYLRHMTGFAESFVLPTRRERWLYLLKTRPKRIARDSHKLRNDLDYRYCSRLGGGCDPGIMQVGVYYEFWGEPRFLSASDADYVGFGGDAIFSVVPGRLAAFFFHEIQSWLCRR